MTQKVQSRQGLDAHRAMRELQERVSKLERWNAEHFGPDVEELFKVFAARERKKPGPKPAHNGMPLTNRDHLVYFLEGYWPEIEPQCIPKPNPSALKVVLHAIKSRERKLPANQARHHWAVQHLLQFLPQVIQFLSSDRFRRDPRQIANAFAGVPNVGSWRSLKLCQAQPCNHPIGQRAIKAYIRRKHPELYGNLLADESLVNFSRAIRGHRSKDTRLAAFNPQHLHSCWQECVPDSRLAVRLHP